MIKCWCGGVEFRSFGPDYSECLACNTLVSLRALSSEKLLVNDDETDFYGKQYWLKHQKQDLGFPDITSRARSDLAERNLHWLKTLLKYRLPPADVMELGCSHGSFVALMRHAGFNASGVEMSPWVIEFGQRTFGVPVSAGPIESIISEPGNLDVIALMDVLEHLPDPSATMRRCLELLKPDGVLLVQTPQFRQGESYEELARAGAPFLQMLRPDEHLYLFSEPSVTELFRRIGAEHISFEPAMFSQYDMFFVVSRAPLHPLGVEQREAALLASPNARIALALLDIREREIDLMNRLRESEADRTARLEQIITLTGMVKSNEAELESLRSTWWCRLGKKAKAL